MKKLIIIPLTLITLSGCTSTGSYFKVGVGYKLESTEINWEDGSVGDHPLSARFELGVERGAVSYGISHDSQWVTGKPFNDDMEYSKTELFIDYKFEL